MAGVAGGAARADHAVRRPRRVRLSALGRPDDHAGAGRRRAALRRRSSARRCSWSRTTTCPTSIRCTGSSGSGCCWCVVVLFARGGILGALDRACAAGCARSASGHDARRCAPKGCRSSSASSRRTPTSRSRSAPGARHALIGPNGAGKTTLINLLTGVLAADRRRRVPRRRADHRACRSTQRVKRGMTRTFQINTLFAGPDRARVGGARGLRAQRAGRRVWHRTVAQRADEIDEARALLRMLRLDARRRHADAQPALRQAAAGRDRAGARDAGRASCCSTSRRPASRRPRAPSCSA